MNFKKITSALLVAGLATAAFAADGEFSLKGNVQTQATKMVADDSSNFSSLWVRANVGGQYKSENLDGLIMLRIFAPQVGNKILADLYWANYKWNFENYKLNLKIGHWKTDWSQSTHFGTYIDKALTARGLWMRDYSHDAIEFGWQTGISQFNAMLATRDTKANTGYIRIEEDLKFNSLDIPLELKLAYRVNAIDRIQNTAALTHHIATYISYSFSPALRVYGEFANIHTQDDGIKMDKKPRNYVAPESSYLIQDKTYNPFYFGLEFTPKEGLLNTLMSSLYIEWERIGDRQKIHLNKEKMDDWAWVFAWAKKVGKSKLQFSLYSGNEISDLGLAFRLTTTFK
ncbi:MAG: hypothetical protein IKN03_04175 [Fibrobacter sp.]|nr:hypothetical protein [Fibrobacter sp.]